MQRFLTDLADVLRNAGLRVVEIDGWETRGRPPDKGDFDPQGILQHHTGARDQDVASTMDDREYAVWLATVGRPDLPPPLCQISTGRDGTVYVCAAGRANHAGVALPSGPMPGGDGNALYLGNENQNTGTEGWKPAQLAAMVLADAAISRAYAWPADHTRAHWETSTTGKWDPGDPDGIPLGDKRVMDMDRFRAAVKATIQEDEMSPEQETRLVERVIAAIHNAKYESPVDPTKTWDGDTITKALYDTTHRTEAAVAEVKAAVTALTAIVKTLSNA